MNKISPQQLYSKAALKLEPSKANADGIAENEIVKVEAQKPKIEEADARVELSTKAKELKKSLEIAKKSEEEDLINEPAIYFVSGFDWWGAGSIKGNYDGVRDMTDVVEYAQHFSWDQQDEIMEDIKKHKPDQPLILVGHSFGGDGVFEIAQRLNTLENNFRPVDLMVTLDSVGFDNDKVPTNVAKNLNYIASGPYEFLNDGPNVAIDYKRTKVENFLRPESHAELDDTTDIQMTILEEINYAIS